jgi:hypothetical protein
MKPSSSTPHRKARAAITPRRHCRMIVDLMTPTMVRADKDSVMVMMSRNMFEAIYALAKRGSK